MWAQRRARDDPRIRIDRDKCSGQAITLIEFECL